MYLNTMIIEATAAQYRQERMHEATVERLLRTARREQQAGRQEQEHVAERLYQTKTHHAWQTIQSYVASFLW